MKKIVKKILILYLISLIIIPNASLAETQVDLFVVPDYSSYLDPDYLILDILTNNNEEIYNTISIRIKYPQEKLIIDSINYENSFCEIMVNEKIDNEKGILNISCGNTEPESATTTNLFRINFNKIESGWAEISLNSSEILAHDGLGTNIIGSTEDHNFYIYK